MRRSSQICLLAIALVVLASACKDGQGPSSQIVDAGNSSDAEIYCSGCNPATQACCDADQKCDQLISSDDPFLGSTACVPDGTARDGEPCAFGEAGAGGYNNCEAGLTCLDGICKDICVAFIPDSCRQPGDAFGTGEYCGLHPDLFSNLIGVCSPACDPTNDTVMDGTVTSTDCGAMQSCWIQESNGATVCVNHLIQASESTQNRECVSYDDSCCAAGFSSLIPSPLASEPSRRNTCARHCSPVRSHAGDFANDQGAAGKCTDEALDLVGGRNGESSQHQCRFIQSFAEAYEAFPIEVGMCVPTLPTAGGSWGNCRDLDWDGIKAVWAAAVATGQDPQQAYEDFCVDPLTLKTEEHCLGLEHGCISLAERNAGLP